jgi:hypothetical protein
MPPPLPITPDQAPAKAASTTTSQAPPIPSNLTTTALTAAAAFTPFGTKRLLNTTQPAGNTITKVDAWITALKLSSAKKADLKKYTTLVTEYFNELPAGTTTDLKTCAVQWGLPYKSADMAHKQLLKIISTSAFLAE